MTKIGYGVAMVLWATAAVAAAQSVATGAERVSRLIVKFRADAAQSLPVAARVARLATDSGEALAHTRRMSLGMDVVSLPSPRSMAQAEALAARLSAHPDVEFADVD